MTTASQATTSTGTVDASARTSTRHVWFGPDDRPLHGWLSVPVSGTVTGAVLLCPPMGEEGRASHRTFRRLAESLAAAGLAALRFDYDGTGDSAGAQDDPDRVGAWLASVEAGRTLLAGLGEPGTTLEVAAVGMRLGATLVATQAVRGGAFSSLVLWDPCLSGRTFLREGQALYAFSEGVADGLPGAPPDDGYRHTPGFQYDAATARAMRHLDLGRLPLTDPLAGRLLLLSREDRPVADAVVDRVVADPAPATLEAALDQDRLLDLLPSDNFVPERSLARVVAWLVEAAGPELPLGRLPEEAAALLPSAGTGSPSVRERVVRLGTVGVVGLVSEPVAPVPADQPWVVLVNVAAEHHIGPGRRWVEQARAWAALGYRCVRVDQSGIGDSPTRPGELEDTTFAPEWLVDLPEVVADLGAGGAPVAMVGLCSGGYSSFEAAMSADVVAVLAVNVRLTLYPAARGTGVFTTARRAAIVPSRPIAWLAARHRIAAGGLWRIYRQLAFWRAPYVVLPRLLRRGTLLHLVACREDAREFTEVAFWRPALWRLRRRPDFRLVVDDAVDHSLLTRRGQLRVAELGTAFVREVHERAAAGRLGVGVR